MKRYIWLFVYLLAVSLPVTGLHAWYETTSIGKDVSYPIWLRLPYLLVGWPEGVTVWALLLTLLAIAEQTSETRTAAQAALRQVNIQATGMRQWVDVEVIDCRVQTWREGTSHPFAVNISFQAVNNTPNVFTILKVETAINQYSDSTEVFIIETNTDLSSKKESESSRYPFYVPTQMPSEEQISAGTVLTLNGQITFIDCLGEKRCQAFGGLYACRIGYVEKMSASGIVPDRILKSGIYLPGVDS
ncbi:hypothetical protein [Granulicella paludicola]|uniref:hypothetical protein n=1 Tax=Granulicella paludicola TaxID=474951 RepID=UPI0021E0C533|nr:hypothetical protein [Granulicella paludicola]